MTALSPWTFFEAGERKGKTIQVRNQQKNI